MAKEILELIQNLVNQQDNLVFTYLDTKKLTESDIPVPVLTMYRERLQNRESREYMELAQGSMPFAEFCRDLSLHAHILGFGLGMDPSPDITFVMQEHTKEHKDVYGEAYLQLYLRLHHLEKDCKKNKK